jgi:transcriptional regulatory protein RtcR
MATLAPGGRIDASTVDDEIARLERSWRRGQDPTHDQLERLLGRERLAGIDLFDHVQLAAVVAVCHEARSLSEAGRKLFAASRQTKQSTNDADRLRKYLARFGLTFDEVRG